MSLGVSARDFDLWVAQHPSSVRYHALCTRLYRGFGGLAPPGVGRQYDTSSETAMLNYQMIIRFLVGASLGLGSENRWYQLRQNLGPGT